jgi:cytoskeleton protein RodZ
MVSEQHAADDVTAQQEQSTPSPGNMLREKRESLGLSQKDIATKLFLKVGQIDDLENDKIDDASSVTFTKGYVRNYAKQLGIDSDAVIAAFEQYHTTVKSPAKLQSFSKRVAKQTHDDRWMMVTYIILLLIIGGVVAWWYQQPSDDGVVDAPLTERVLKEAADTPLSTVATERDSSTMTAEPAFGQAQPNSADVESQSMQPDLPSSVDTNDASEPAAEIAASTIDETNNVTALITNNDVEVDAPTTEDLIDTAAPISMLFNFDNDCWVSVKDATGETIAYGVKEAGRVMEISGIPPVQVTLGAPQNVRISVNGDAVDISSYHGRTARFSLPL